MGIGLGGLLEEGAHGKSPKCLDGNLGDFGEFCKGLGLCGLPEEGTHEKSPKCLDGNLGDFGGFCKGLRSFETLFSRFSDDLLSWAAYSCFNIMQSI